MFLQLLDGHGLTMSLVHKFMFPISNLFGDPLTLHLEQGFSKSEMKILHTSIPSPPLIYLLSFVDLMDVYGSVIMLFNLIDTQDLSHNSLTCITVVQTIPNTQSNFPKLLYLRTFSLTKSQNVMYF